MVVSAENRRGVPEAEVTDTVVVPGVKVPLFEKRVPEVPSRVIVPEEPVPSSVPAEPMTIYPVVILRSVTPGLISTTELADPLPPIDTVLVDVKVESPCKSTLREFADPEGFTMKSPFTVKVVLLYEILPTPAVRTGFKMRL